MILLRIFHWARKRTRVSYISLAFNRGQFFFLVTSPVTPCFIIPSQREKVFRDQSVSFSAGIFREYKTGCSTHIYKRFLIFFMLRDCCFVTFSPCGSDKIGVTKTRHYIFRSFESSACREVRRGPRSGGCWMTCRCNSTSSKYCIRTCIYVRRCKAFLAFRHCIACFVFSADSYVIAFLGDKGSIVTDWVRVRPSSALKSIVCRLSVLLLKYTNINRTTDLSPNRLITFVA